MHTYTVEFRIQGALLVPSRVTEKLGLEPCQTREKTNSSSDDKKKIRNALWAYNGAFEEKEWDDLETGLTFLLKILLTKKEVIKSELNDFDMYWWCGHFQSSFNGGLSFQ